MCRSIFHSPPPKALTSKARACVHWWCRLFRGAQGTRVMGLQIDCSSAHVIVFFFCSKHQHVIGTYSCIQVLGCCRAAFPKKRELPAGWQLNISCEAIFDGFSHAFYQTENSKQFCHFEKLLLFRCQLRGGRVRHSAGVKVRVALLQQREEFTSN